MPTSPAVRRSIDDQGFSLSELMIVLTLLAVVLGGIYGFSSVVVSGARVNDFQATAARETGNSLWMVEKHLMQEIRIEQVSPYRVVFITDALLDGDLKRHEVQAHADGRITLSTWATARTSGWPNVGAPRVVALAHHSSNVADAVPVFEYFRKDLSEITGTQIAESAASDTRSIRIVMRIRVQDSVHEDSRLIVLRNRE